MLVGIDVVFDFPSQHEGEKSFLSSHWGFFFTAQAETGSGLISFGPNTTIVRKLPLFFSVSEISLNIFEAEERLPRAIPGHSYNKKMLGVSSTWWVTSPA